jgi:hypothetical protein
MAPQSEHGRLIAAAAKSALKPLGCVRKGRSRLWLSDHRLWVIVADFQPSGWSKGSYLNIAAQWLWAPSRRLAFTDRPIDFIPFVTAEQFAPLIAAMAERAAQEILALRAKFRSFADVYDYVIAHATRDDWPTYWAAVAAGLVGDIETSRRFFRRMAQWPTDGYEGQKKLKTESARLAALLDEPVKFRAVLADTRSDSRCLSCIS